MERVKRKIALVLGFAMVVGLALTVMAAPAHANAVSITRLDKTDNDGVETSSNLYFEGDRVQIVLSANPDAGESTQLQIQHVASGTFVLNTGCLAGSIGTQPTAGQYTFTDADPIGLYVARVNHYTNSTCSAGLTTDTENLRLVDVVVTNPATGDPVTVVNGTGSISVRVLGLPTNSPDWNVEWGYTTTGNNHIDLDCDNELGADRPDTNASGTLPIPTGPGLRFPVPANSSTPYNHRPNYETANTECTFAFVPNGATLEVRLTDPNAVAPFANDTVIVALVAVDKVAPNTVQTGGPTNGSVTNDSTPQFTFSSNDPNASFLCSVDGGPQQACGTGGSGSFTPGPLSNGSHSVVITAVDAAGNQDPTPLQITFTVDTTSGAATLTAPPNGSEHTIADAAAFCGSGSFDACGTATDSSGVQSVQYRMQNPDTGLCYSSLTGSYDTACGAAGTTFSATVASPGQVTTNWTAGLVYYGDGRYRLFVAVTDTANNQSAFNNVGTFRVDDTNPTVTITSGPSGNAGAISNATFTFTGSDPGGSGIDHFRCTFSGPEGSFVIDPCTSPFNTNSIIPGGLQPGSHTFTVVSVDDAGNVSPVASRTFTTTAAPTVTFTQTPNNPTASRNATFAFASSNGGATQCQLDGGPITNCSSPQSFSGLGTGFHTFCVRAFDPVSGTFGPFNCFTWQITDSAPIITTPITSPDIVASAGWANSQDGNGAFFYTTNEAGSYLQMAVNNTHRVGVQYRVLPNGAPLDLYVDGTFVGRVFTNQCSFSGLPAGAIVTNNGGGLCTVSLVTPDTTGTFTVMYAGNETQRADVYGLTTQQ